MTEPSAGYHGVRFYETFGDFGFTMKARMEVLRVFGPTIAPFNAWLLLQGIETLPVRMDRHVRQRDGRGEIPARPPEGRVGELPGPARTTATTRSRRSYLPQGRGVAALVRHQGRLRGGREVHRGRCSS